MGSGTIMPCPSMPSQTMRAQLTILTKEEGNSPLLPLSSPSHHPSPTLVRWTVTTSPFWKGWEGEEEEEEGRMRKEGEEEEGGEEEKEEEEGRGEGGRGGGGRGRGGEGGRGEDVEGGRGGGGRGKEKEE